MSDGASLQLAAQADDVLFHVRGQHIASQYMLVCAQVGSIT